MFASCKVLIVVTEVLALSLPVVSGQQTTVPGSRQTATPAGTEQSQQPVRDAAELGPAPTYVLGPGDGVVIRALHAEEVSDKPFPIDADGNLTVPMIGKVKASGLTVSELEAAITKALQAYIKQPEAVVTLVQFRSEPVFLVGAFRAPGVYQLQGRRTLTEVLSSTGGLLPNASRKIKLTRRIERGKIALPSAIEDPEGKVSSVEVNFSSGLDPIRPDQDVVLQPFDVIKATLSDYVFVNGEVAKAGAFELDDRESISVTKIVSMAGGLTPNAAAQKAHVLRTVLDTAKRAEIPVDIKSIMAGRSNDFPLLPNDVLVVPRGTTKKTSFGRIMLYVSGPLITTVVYLVRR